MSAVEWGMPTLLELEGARECCALCRELGLQFVELNMNMPQYQAEAMRAEYLRTLMEKYGVYFTIHLDENLNVCDFNGCVAEAWRETVRETLALARAIEAPIVNMHLTHGVYFTMPEGRIYLFDAYRARYREGMRSFRDMCEREIGGAKAYVCVENCEGFLPFQLEALDMLLESPVFGLTYDVGHDHAAGGADAQTILARADRLLHMHLHDAKGQKNHLTLGEGEIEWERYRCLAQERGCRVVLETKTVAGLRRSAHKIM